MNPRIKRICKHIIGIIIIAFLTFFVERVCFNFGTITNDTYSDEFTPDNQNGHLLKKISTKDLISYRLDNKGKYVNKLLINYRTEEDFKFTVKFLDSKGEKTGKKDVYKTGYTAFNKNYIVVNDYVDEILITIDCSNARNRIKEGIDYGKFNSIVLSNEVQYNVYRIIFVAVSLVLLYIILVCRKTMTEHLALMFFITSMLMGTALIILEPIKLMSWDEQIHFRRAHNAGYSKTVEYTLPEYMLYNMTAMNAESIEERQMVAEFLGVRNKDTYIEEPKDQSFVEYNYRAYLPQTFGLKIGKKLRMSFQWTLWFAKLLNLLCYSIVMAAAIKLAKCGKKILICIGLMPTSIFLATSFSYDAFVTAFLMLGFVAIINEFIDCDKKIEWKNIALAVSATVIGSFSKCVYIPMLLLLVFIPKEKFYSKKQRVMFIAGVLAVFLIMMSTFVMPVISNAANNIDVAGDSRGGDTSVTKQIEYILENPLDYTGLLLSSIVKSIMPYIFGYRIRTFFAYMGGDYESFYLLSVVLAVAVTLTGEKKEVLERISTKLKVLLGIMLFGVAVLIWTALYLDFTPVGLNVINGVQERYYIPLLMPFAMLFFNKKIGCKMEEFNYNRILFLTNLIILFGCICEKVLLPYCS